MVRGAAAGLLEVVLKPRASARRLIGIGCDARGVQLVWNPGGARGLMGVNERSV